MLRRIAVLLIAGCSTMCSALAATKICNSLTEDVQIAFNVLRKGGVEETFGWKVVEAKKCRSFSDLGVDDLFMFSTRPNVRFEGTGYKKKPEVLCLEDGESSFVIGGEAAYPHPKLDYNCMFGQKANFYLAAVGKTIRLYPEGSSESAATESSDDRREPQAGSPSGNSAPSASPSQGRGSSGQSRQPANASSDAGPTRALSTPVPFAPGSKEAQDYEKKLAKEKAEREAAAEKARKERQEEQARIAAQQAKEKQASAQNAPASGGQVAVSYGVSGSAFVVNGSNSTNQNKNCNISYTLDYVEFGERKWRDFSQQFVLRANWSGVAVNQQTTWAASTLKLRGNIAQWSCS